MSKLALLLLVTVAACRQPRVYGEVHIHQFPQGSHPAALFVASAVVAPDERADSFVSDGVPQAVEGDCRLYGPGREEVVKAVDGGRVRVQGGQSLPALTLAFGGADRGYQPDNGFRPGVSVFNGGELLTYEGEGSGAAPAFRGTLRAPMPLTLTSPGESFSSKDLAVRWRPGDAARVLVTLVASQRTGGAYGIIRCAARDAAGMVAIPASLMKRLPPAPRDLQLEARRDAVARATSDRGAVILHASWAVTRSGSD